MIGSWRKLAVDMNTARRRNHSQIFRAREVWAAYSRNPNAALRDIMAMTGYTLNMVVRHRRLLRQMGWIDFEDNKDRAVVVRVPHVNMGIGVRLIKS